MEKRPARSAADPNHADQTPPATQNASGVSSFAGWTDDSQEDWDRLISRVGPAFILAAIQGWLGPGVARWHTADDVWQETLLVAWRDRKSFEWRGLAAFRRWLLTIARHRAQDLADQVATRKRGDGRERRLGDMVEWSREGGARGSGSLYAGPVSWSSPDQTAMDRERAEAFHQALATLPEEYEVIVRRRLFEEVPLEQLASELTIGVEAVRYRFRKGAALYREALRRVRAAPTTETSRSEPK